MSDGNTPKSTRKQAEADILSHMRAILTRVKNKGSAPQMPSNQSAEPVDKKHVLSVVSQFTSIKQETRH